MADKMGSSRMKTLMKRSIVIGAVALALSACSSWDDWKKSDFDYFHANPVPTKDQLMKQNLPDERVQQGSAHSQTILDKMAGYDQPITGPMPRGEGGIVSEFTIKGRPENTDYTRVVTEYQTEAEKAAMAAPVAPKKAPAAASSADPNAAALRQMLEGNNAAATAETDAPIEPVDPNQLRQVEINFNNTSLRAVIEFVFGEYIKKPYVIASDFADREVNWVAQGQFTNAEVRNMFESFLDIQGVVVSESGGVYSVSNKGASARTIGGGEFGTATGIWRLHSLDVTEALQIIRPFVSNPEGVMILDKRNTLVVNGSSTEVRNIDNFLKTLDAANLKDKHIIVYAPKHISAEALVTLMQALPQQMGLNASEGKKQIEVALVTGAKRAVIVTDSKETRNLAMQYIEQVDQPGKKQRQVFYYALRNQIVEDVRTTLTSLLPGLLPDVTEITVVANTPTNSLVVTATPDQFFEIRKVIDRLDYRIPSVLIDATIVEVQLNDNLSYGVEWFLGGRIGRVRGDISTDLANAAIPNPAARIGVISLSSNTFATLDLLASETSLRVLSRPRVLVKNRATATIKSTDQIRVVKSVLTTDVQQGGDNIPKREFEDKEVGVSLQVTPRIAEDGTVNMAVKIQDSRQGADDDASGERPRFNVREINTELVTKNGETILIGGLIRNNVSRVKTKVPFFGDLPILGQAFANTNDTDQRTELVIFLSPYVVMDEVSARLVSEAVGGLARVNPDLTQKLGTPDPDLSSPPSDKPKPKEETPVVIKDKDELAVEKSLPARLLDEPPEDIRPANKPLSPDAPGVPPPNEAMTPSSSSGTYIYSDKPKSGPPTLAPEEQPSPVPENRIAPSGPAVMPLQ